MKKWHELSLNSLMNIAVALIAGGLLKLFLDKGSVVASVSVVIAGAYIQFAIILAAKNFEEE